jgi:DNA mismatch repair protein MutL
MQAIALVHPNIAFELKFNGKTCFKTTAQNEQIQTIKETFSTEISSNLKQVENTDKLSGLRISGYVSSPDYTRSSKKDYYMFVNSRIVKCPVFQKSIDTVYRNLIGNTRYPFIVLNLEIPPCDVDVNVHPTKKEVRYKNPNQIFNFIYTSVNMALKSVIRTEEPTVTIEESKVQPIKPVETMPEDMFVDNKASISDVFIRPEEKQESPLYNIRPKED